MTSERHRLFTLFQPEHYLLIIPKKSSPNYLTSQVIITGKKTGKPSKRLTFHQKDLKIRDAKITQQSKKGFLQHDILRINHIKSFEEVRLHTNVFLYPGSYQVVMDFSTKAEPGLAQKPKTQISRSLFPCVDEPEARAIASFEVK